MDPGDLDCPGFFSNFGIGNHFREFGHECIDITFDFPDFREFDASLLFVVFVYWKLSVFGAVNLN